MHCVSRQALREPPTDAGHMPIRATSRRLFLLLLLLLALVAAWLRRRSVRRRRAIRHASTKRELRKGGGGFAAFLSHYKIEAATEARWLQEKIEVALFGRQLFLDSDDLVDLTKLRDHVRESDCVLLLQTRSVLSRPWCIVELLTAIDAGIPIIGVSILSGAHTYDFGQACAFMTHLDTLLDAEKRAQISALGIDMADAAFKLAHVLPNIISLPLNMNESRAILHARIGEIVGAMKRARLPAITADRAAWLRSRGEAPAPLLHGAGSAASATSSSAAAAGVERAPAQHAASACAAIPPEVPELPLAMQPRPALLSALKAAVLRSAAASSDAPQQHDGHESQSAAGATMGATTAVVAPRKGSAVATAAHGMGGVGKSCLAAALVRDAEIGRAFERLLWVSVSQTPDALRLLRDLHFQLLSCKMDASVDDERYAAQVLREAAKGRRVLCVLDDVWERRIAEHAPHACIHMCILMCMACAFHVYTGLGAADRRAAQLRRRGGRLGVRAHHADPPSRGGRGLARAAHPGRTCTPCMYTHVHPHVCGMCMACTGGPSR